MGIEHVRLHLKKWDKDKDVLEFGISSATVELAALAVGTTESRIAKSLTFKADSAVHMIVTAGDMKIDNRKYKDRFGCKAVMLSSEEVSHHIGHEVGGVCPFGIPNAVAVYLDISLRRFDHVYPACGSHNSAIKLTCAELEDMSGAKEWIDVCKSKE